ncbi:paraquat-inducible protein A [Mucilaginibacter sp. L3T2-6]|uniref:paraquat-inducible protein A n=1 Tax=Mucilaginibacter sp. L3T2-6 TaxID=3062491 RepID=UPI0026747518|nr:paraquat-inducible protein A [Mucilaginibacter sp. L3T2-6]MDO3641394.1 paraquat-inducible protein A [Mucilaginibacter sp. L3T2-6]MDV6213845.1 paraquat-inducible protein A [Mucilaginibacter sp. L3T2-6]
MQHALKKQSHLLPTLLLIAGLGILLCAEAFFGFRLHTLSKQQEQLKRDYANVNSINLGLFSAEQWRDDISGIINHQVRHFTLTPVQKRQLQKEVEQIMLALINKAEAMVNKKPKSLGGKLKKLAVKTFVNTDKIKAKVPALAKQVIAKVDNPASKARLSKLAMRKFTDVAHSGYFDSTATARDSLLKKMYPRYHVSNQQALNKTLNNKLQQMRTTMYSYCFAMLACILVVLTLWWLLRKKVQLHTTLFIMSLLFAFILLAVGLTASMIEVDARISTLDFTLLGEHVVFRDQVLFFQSKSILEVVEVLVSHAQADSILVGVLILVFSILFPITKLTATGIHLLSKRKMAENRFIKYFAFQSGKWSMADVIVIAILMTYIGLNGLIDGTLAALHIQTTPLTIIATNNTALQPGYIIFISFVLYGLILSTILKFITPYDAH